MTRNRISSIVAVLMVCTLGAVTLYLFGVPVPPAVTIGVLAAAATVFSRWARSLRAGRRDSDSAARRPSG